MRKTIVIALFCLLGIADVGMAKILIITHAYNRPDFIELQCLTFQKFLLDEYEFVVFNDAPPGFIHNWIKQECQSLGVCCFTIPQELHVDPLNISERHCVAIKYSLDFVGYRHDGIVAFFDSDLFLIRPLSIEDLMSDVDIVSAYRQIGRAHV